MLRQFILLLICFSVISSTSVFAKSMAVQSKDNAIRQECKFVSPIVKKVKYRDQLEIVSQDSDWFMVKFEDVEGCIHKSALTLKTVNLRNLQANNPKDTQAQEVSLAGKGFFEEAHTELNPQITYGVVEAIEMNNISYAQVKDFANKGYLKIP